MEITRSAIFLQYAFELHAAARRCHVTRPSLTRAIELLEKEFGGHLFHRERSRIRLTELGRIVQPYLQEAWDNTQVAKRQAKDYVSKAPTQLSLRSCARLLQPC
jgi:LysR family hydrogen peroxide-inducible transcriptional activator